MDVNRWKVVLFEWIKASELIDVFGSIEHLNIEEFFCKFYFKLFGDSHKNHEKITISGFLKEIFPDYEIFYDETTKISSQDYLYILSLFLYYSCVLRENEFFQKCCKNLNAMHQIAIVNFLEYFNNNPKFTKESIRAAIKQSTTVTSPQKSAANIFTISPKKNEKQQPRQPPTPNKDFLNEKLRELKHLKTELDNEKFERNMLEVELRQSEEKVEHLMTKCKTLNNESQSFQAELLLRNNQPSSISPTKNHQLNQLRNKMQKEIQTREDKISDLKYENDNITSVNKKCKARMTAMEKQLREMRNKISDLDASVEELQCESFLKDEKIQMLEDEKKDLLDFINETRSSYKDTSVSSDMLDFSNSVYHTINDSDLGENLAKSVIDLQLKEKDLEVCGLKDLLEVANNEKNGLKVKIDEFAKKMDEKSNEIFQLQQDREELQNLIEKLQHDLHESHESQLEAIKSQKNARLLAEKSLEQEKYTSEVINEELLKKIAKLSEENEQKISTLNSQLIMSAEKIQDLQIETEIERNLAVDAAIENKSLVKTNEVLKSEISRHEKKIESSEKIIESMKNDQNEKDKKIQSLETTTDTFKSQLVKKTATITQLKAEFTAKSIENQKIKKELQNLSEKNSEITRKNLKMSEEYSNFTEMTQKYSKLSEENSKLTEKYSEIQSQIKILQDENCSKLTESLVEVENYKKQEQNWIKERKSLLYDIESLKVDVDNGKKDVREAMEVKLVSIKDQMKEIFTRAMDNLNNTVKDQKCQIDELNLQLDNYRNMEQELIDCKNNNSILLSKLRFSDKNFEMDGSLGIGQKTLSKECNFEKFDNAYLNDLKLGTPFDEILKSECDEKRKSTMSARRSSLIVPSKRKTQISFRSLKNAFKSTSTGNEKKNTSGKIMAIVSRFSKAKNEQQSSSRSRRNRLSRTLTPKNLNECDKKWIIDRVDNDNDQNPLTMKKEIELDRKMKRDKARDENRPNLNDDCDETVIETEPDLDLESESDWIEDVGIVVSTPKYEKSLKMLKSFRSCTSLRKTLSARSSDGLDRFQSCRSLNKTSSFLSQSKSCTRDFVDTHIAMVNRMSDYRVQPRIRELKDDHYEESKGGFWSLLNPLPLTLAATFASGLTYSIYNHYYQRNE